MHRYLYIIILLLIIFNFTKFSILINELVSKPDNKRFVTSQDQNGLWIGNIYKNSKKIGYTIAEKQFNSELIRMLSNKNSYENKYDILNINENIYLSKLSENNDNNEEEFIITFIKNKDERIKYVLNNLSKKNLAMIHEFRYDNLIHKKFESLFKGDYNSKNAYYDLVNLIN